MGVVVRDGASREEDDRARRSRERHVLLLATHRKDGMPNYGWAVIHVDRGIIAMTTDWQEAYDINGLWYGSEIIELNEYADKRIGESITSATELQETLKTGLNRRVRGAIR